MEMQNLEQSQNSLRRLNAAIDELITLIRNQRKQIADAINAQEQSLSLNEAKIAALEAQVTTLADDNAKLQAGVNAVAENGESSEKIQELQLHGRKTCICLSKQKDNPGLPSAYVLMNR